MFNTSDAPPRSEGASTGTSRFNVERKLQRKIRAHIKLVRARNNLVGPSRKLTHLTRL